MSAKAPRHVPASSVRVVRSGHGANCSSIGSVVDTLFATAVVGSAIFAAVTAALSREEVEVVRAPEGAGRPESELASGDDGAPPP